MTFSFRLYDVIAKKNKGYHITFKQNMLFFELGVRMRFLYLRKYFHAQN